MTRLCFVSFVGCIYCNKTELSIFMLAPVSISVSIGNEFRDFLYSASYLKNKDVAREFAFMIVWCLTTNKNSAAQ